jgi:preprotein translocase subunit SecG
MFTFLLVLHAIIAAALVTVILMQRSEGGGLGMGGSPSGLMSARGAADFLTRATTILAGLFVAMCILLATLASLRSSGGEIDTSLARKPAAAAGAALPVDNGAVPAPAPTDPLAGATAPAANTTAPAAATPRPAETRPAPRSSDPVTRSTTAPAGNAATPAPTRVAPPSVVPATSPASNGSSPSN